MKSPSLAVAAILICASAPFAAGRASAQEAGASVSRQLDGFVGDGICTGAMPAMGKSAARASTGKYHGEKTLDGQWAVIRYDEDRTAAVPKPFSVVQYIGYDAAAKHLVTVLFENTGGSYATGVSSGMKGNTMTFDESILMDGKRVQARDVFTNGEGGMSTHAGMMRDASGKWIAMDKETCHKA
jgi:hypothetical protein